ncbi:MAG: hypothetical protein A4E58_03321 [Syntrophorhabdus sp. PtaB.Bin006]|nr:MAG: hypothetical protein A4E58_03321 [Syntrophorhabdus sp. PtaB.Bin006]
MFKIKLTGISTPFGGISWKFEKSEKEVAKQLITFLEDRRVLRQRLGHAGTITGSPPHLRAVKSVMEIRDRLRDDLEKVDTDSILGQSMRAMRHACRRFLSRAEIEAPGETYTQDLDELRRVFSENMLHIGETFGFAIDAVSDWGDDEQKYRKAYSELFFVSHDVRLVPPEEDG